jgi:hypothetical protein
MATLLNRYNLMWFQYFFVKCSTVEGFIEKSAVNFRFKWSNYTLHIIVKLLQLRQ